jgi:hypothetical protein
MIGWKMNGWGFKTIGMEISKKVIVPVIGTLYHVSWANNRGKVGRCISVNHDSKTCRMKSPGTGREWNTEVKWEDLQHTRRNEAKLKS